MSNRGGEAPARITLSLHGGKVCPVTVGPGAIADLTGILREIGAFRLAVITDSNLETTHAASVAALARSSGAEAVVLAFPAGERSKTRATKESLEDRMIDAGLGRDAAVLAVGGGVAGDLAGFVAATYMRGIPFVHIPTSLIAMADAAIGGKTGVDTPRGKNLIGAFHQPAAVLADTRFLGTLPRRELTAGFAEMAKAGAVADAGLFRALEALAERLANGDVAAVEEALPAAVQVKASVVSADEKESGLRKILNFGHTVGHGIEADGGYAMAHGEAVSIGMIVEAEIGVRLGILAPEAAGRISALLRGMGLPVAPPEGTSPSRVWKASASDKKARGGRIEIVVPREIGEMARGERDFGIPIADEVALEAMEACWTPSR